MTLIKKLFIGLSYLSTIGISSATINDTLKYEIDLINRNQNLFEVKLSFKSNQLGTKDFQISKWTPGYYQILDFQKNVIAINAYKNKSPIEINKIEDNKWRISTQKNDLITIKYTIKANENFIAKAYINNEFAFVRPTGVFIYPTLDSNEVITIDFKNNPWKNITSGLQTKHNKLVAQNINELLDSPILVGNLDDLGSFIVNGKEHYFLGRELNDFDMIDMMSSMQKVVSETVKMMGDIPYDDYTFISIGKGNGGIEQTNSTALTFNGEIYKYEAGKQKLLNFLTHEYFHHFNAKRIIPIELSPIDYSRINRTEMLWVAEGLSVYYEAILMNRAGVKTREQMLEEWRSKIEAFENNPGKEFQTLVESSKNTWEDGPFGIKGKTISVYEKGPLVGMLLDLTIRHHSNNKYALDDVMRALYNRYYKAGKRGYTQKEFRSTCEEFSGINLEDIFKYTNTLEAIDYAPYFKYAGLEIYFRVVEGKTEVKLLKVKKMNDLQSKIFEDLFRKTK